MLPLGPYPGNYQAFMPWTPPPPNPRPCASGKGQDGDRFESEKKPAEEKKRPWYASFGKEVLINGLTIAASIAGGMVGGVFGAMAAGSLTSATLGYLDQKWFKKQKVDWASVAIDGALGLIPGTVAEGIAKSGSHLLAKSTGKAVDIGAQESIRRGVIVGATDGLVMGSVGGFAQGAYDSYKQDGKVNWGDAAKDGVKSILPAVIGGSLGVGAFLGLRAGRLKPSALFRRTESSEHLDAG